MDAHAATYEVQKTNVIPQLSRISHSGPCNAGQKSRTRGAYAILALFVLYLSATGRANAQVLPSAVGRIEGDDLQVKTTTPTGIETNAAPTVVASGSDVTLRSGHALLLLDAGGEISICGPAHFSVLKAAGTVTLALDYGIVHPSIESAEALTIYTPMVVATPMAISGGRRDTTLGLDQSGRMCILTARGAIRVEPQFAGQSLIVPQGGTVSLVGGELEPLNSEPPPCSCEFPRAKMEPPKVTVPPATTPSAALSSETSTLSHPKVPAPTDSGAKKSEPPPIQEPIYTVLMPPMSFNAAAPNPPADPNPETIQLLREVRVVPAATFNGHVNPAEPDVAATASPSVASPIAISRTSSSDASSERRPSLFARIRNFFRGKPKSAN